MCTTGSLRMRPLCSCTRWCQWGLMTVSRWMDHYQRLHTALVCYQDQSTVLLLLSQYCQPGHSAVGCQQSELCHWSLCTQGGSSHCASGRYLQLKWTIYSRWQGLCVYGSSPEVGGQTAVVTCSVSEAANTARNTNTCIFLVKSFSETVAQKQ